MQRAVGVVKEVLEEIGLKPLPLAEVNNKLYHVPGFVVRFPFDPVVLVGNEAIPSPPFPSPVMFAFSSHLSFCSLRGETAMSSNGVLITV